MALVSALLLAAPAAAQIPATPVLQNAFANPGLAFAANFGGGSGQSFFGAAGAYGIGGGRIQLSAGAGVHRANQASRGAYGGRVAANVWNSAGGSLGVGAFVGFGGAPRTKDANDVTTNAAVVTIPAGITIGFRRAIGEVRGISVYASPMYRWTRAEANEVSTSSANIAGAVGVDFAVTRSLGVTAGADFGKGSGDTGTSSTFGVAVSFVPGR